MDSGSAEEGGVIQQRAGPGLCIERSTGYVFMCVHSLSPWTNFSFILFKFCVGHWGHGDDLSSFLPSKESLERAYGEVCLYYNVCVLR